MSGSTQYHEKCVCGSTITLTENFEFIPDSRLQKQIDEWKEAHKDCLPLFLRIQRVRVKQLEHKSELLKD